MALITVADFEARYPRDLTASEALRVDKFIDDASALAVDIAGTDFVIDGTLTVPASVVPVVFEMVRRKLDNPKGYASGSVDDVSFAGMSTAGIFATREESKVLRKAGGLIAGASAMDLEGYMPAGGVTVPFSLP